MSLGDQMERLLGAPLPCFKCRGREAAQNSLICRDEMRREIFEVVVEQIGVDCVLTECFISTRDAIVLWVNKTSILLANVRKTGGLSFTSINEGISALKVPCYCKIRFTTVL